jgi:hypothetical protein
MSPEGHDDPARGIFMYYPDLSVCTYFPFDTDCLIAVGWLEPEYPFTTGDVPGQLVESLHLRRRDSWQPVTFLGPHRCRFCPPLEYEDVSAGNFLRVEQGVHSAGNIFIPANDVVYVSPEGITHYIEEHGYRPPDEFIEAAIEAPLPSSPQYFELLEAAGLLASVRAASQRAALHSERGVLGLGAGRLQGERPGGAGASLRKMRGVAWQALTRVLKGSRGE